MGSLQHGIALGAGETNPSAPPTSFFVFIFRLLFPFFACPAVVLGETRKPFLLHFVGFLFSLIWFKRGTLFLVGYGGRWRALDKCGKYDAGNPKHSFFFLFFSFFSRNKKDRSYLRGVWNPIIPLPLLL